MSREELQDFVRRLVKGPSSPAYYERLLDAAAVTRRGLELLQELARDVEEEEAPIREIADPLDLSAFRPGDRLLNPDEEEAATGLGDFAVERLRLSLGAGSVEDLEELLGVLTDSGLKAELLSALSAFLKPVPAATLESLWLSSSDAQDSEERGSAAEAFEKVEGSLSRPVRPRRANLGQLVRSLERALRRYQSIEACWLALSSAREPFARRFAAGVHLCRKTRELVRDEPREAARWALRVGRIADGLSPETDTFTARMASFLSLFASAHIGNALRVQGNLLLAERLFLPWEEDDLLGLRAEYLALKATLRRVQRRFPEALELLDAAGRVAERRDFPGADELLAQTRIAAARTFTAMSEFKAAAHELRRALDVIESAGLSDMIRWLALQNLGDCLSKAGHLSEAGPVMAEVEELGVKIGLPETDRLRATWIAARLRRPEEWAEAREQLAFVRQRFIDLGLLNDAALSSLELAEWHAEEHAAGVAILGEAVNPEHLAAIRELASESAQFFAGADITPEAFAALALFQYVSLSAAPSPQALRKVERLLRQATLG